MQGYKKTIFILTILLLPQIILFAAEENAPHQEAQIERGKPNLFFDGLGNILSIPQKIILLNPKVDSHHVSKDTEKYLVDFIASNPKTMKDVKVRINQWAPVGDFKHLIRNKKISWWWRVFPGIPVTLISSTTGRILGGDHYNPFTDTICIFSDEPAILLHEGMHAKDFSERALRGRDSDWYAIGRLLPPVALSQESTASDEAINYLRKKKDRKQEMKSYRVLYPAFGTYVGGYSGIPYGNAIGAMAGQVSGFWTQHEKRISYAAIDGARRGREIIKDFNSDPVANALIKQDAERRVILNKAFRLDKVKIK